MTIGQYLQKYKFLIIAMILMIVPLLGIFIFAISGKTYYGSDIAFHYQRYLELRFDIGHGILPQFLTHAGAPLGNAINIFYPYETLIPFILLTWFIHRPINLVYSIFYLIWLAISISSYFSAKYYFHSRKTGLVFSILYTACSTISNAMLLNNDIGQSLSYIWAPLALFGFLWVLKDGQHWLMLSLGLSGLIMSHVLSTILIAVLLIILGICNLKPIITNIHILMGYIKAIVLTLMTTAIFWIPFIYIMRLNSYYNPKYGSDVPFWISGLFKSQSGNIHENCGFIDGLGIIVGLVTLISIIIIKFHIKYLHIFNLHIPKVDWELWIIGILYWLCNINIKPVLNFFSNSPLNVFQFSYRTALPLHLCFTYIAVKWLVGLYSSYHSQTKAPRIRYKRIFIGLCITFALFMQIGNQINEKLIYHQRAIYYSNSECSYNDQMIKIQKHHHQGQGWRLNNRSFKYMRNTNILQDYQPLNTTTMSHYKPASIICQHFFLIHKQNNPILNRVLNKPIILTQHGVKFTTNKTLYDVSLPLLWYHGYQYTVTNHHKLIHWHKNPHANFVEIPIVRPGTYLLQLHPKINKNTNYALIISSAGWIIFITSWGYELIKSKREHEF